MIESRSFGQISRVELFRVLAPYRGPRNLRGGLLVILDCALFALTIYYAAAAGSPGWRVLAGLLAGLLITRLWVIGHDACHQSLFSTKRANRVIGRLCFLPSLTPYSMWEVGHNIAHHGFNNLRGRDYIWAPLGADEYLGLPAWRRWLERIYRSGLGVGLYYLIELWWRRLYVPTVPFVGVRRKEFTLDFLLVTAFALVWTSVAGYTGHLAGVGAGTAILTAVVLPFCVWNVLVGLVIHVHHIHPDIPWFDNKQDWLDAQAVFTGTAHIDWPVFNVLLHNILSHPAHHIDCRVSLVELPAAQRALEQAFPAAFPRRQLGWADYMAAVRKCKVFDYQAGCWRAFPRR